MRLRYHLIGPTANADSAEVFTLTPTPSSLFARRAKSRAFAQFSDWLTAKQELLEGHGIDTEKVVMTFLGYPHTLGPLTEALFQATNTLLSDRGFPLAASYALLETLDTSIDQLDQESFLEEVETHTPILRLAADRTEQLIKERPSDGWARQALDRATLLGEHYEDLFVAACADNDVPMKRLPRPETGPRQESWRRLTAEHTGLRSLRP